MVLENQQRKAFGVAGVLPGATEIASDIRTLLSATQRELLSVEFNDAFRGEMEVLIPRRYHTEPVSI